jgi:hypothetical protein
MKEETIDKNIPLTETNTHNFIEKKETKQQVLTEHKHKDHNLKKDLSNEVLYFSINQDSK